jgi:hypothetical protein
MSLLLGSLWRALAYCLHPRVILLSLLPLLLTVALSLGLGYLYWSPAVAWVHGLLEAASWVNSVWSWLDGQGLGRIKVVLAPLIVIFAVTPLIVMLSLLTVALLMTPALTRLVALRRFPTLAREGTGSWLYSLLWSLGATLAALLMLLLSIPLWLIPPLILVLPPLIWGWLTYRVLAFDALSGHASAAERRELFRRHRGTLLLMGLFCGYMGSAPSLIWASGVVFAAAFVVLVPLAIWIYTLVFALSSLWFAHYLLAALQSLRDEAAAVPAPPVPAPAPEATEKPLALPHDAIVPIPHVP